MHSTMKLEEDGPLPERTTQEERKPNTQTPSLPKTSQHETEQNMNVCLISPNTLRKLWVKPKDKPDAIERLKIHEIAYKDCDKSILDKQAV
ncbi:hypothetical protein Trydic_g15552 [Trypoxylus dichotomus]